MYNLNEFIKALENERKTEKNIDIFMGLSQKLNLFIKYLDEKEAKSSSFNILTASVQEKIKFTIEYLNVAFEEKQILFEKLDEITKNPTIDSKKCDELLDELIIVLKKLQKNDR